MARDKYKTTIPDFGGDQTWLPIYLEFTSHMSIPSKELVGGDKLSLSDVRYNSQRMFLEQICAGLDAGVHDFKVLKARQLGVSTEGLALDVFWLSVHEKIQGALVTDTEANRGKFRILIEQFIESLPKGLRVGIKRHNRDVLELNNGSCLDYLVAGQKKTNATLGQSRALNFLHATEVASWGSEEGVASLRASLAQKHPHRLYIWESTAHGFNHWHEMCDEAKEDAITQRFVFIGWWSKDDYSLDRGTREYNHYWDDTLSDEEARLCGEVEKRYGFRITPGQIAWHRWYRSTQLPNEDLMNQNFPWTEDQAFILSGLSFFPLRRIAENIMHIKAQGTVYTGYRYHLGGDFLATDIEKVTRPNESELRIWEEPHPDGVYAMGVDPAYGRGEDQKDNHSIELVRCYADRVVQVAEYATASPETYQLTWVMAHLAGAYKNVVINLEVFGPGKAVMEELRHLKQLLDFGYLQGKMKSLGMKEIFDCVRWYLYHRPDSLAGNYVYNFITTADSKLVMMNQLRDNYALNMMEIRSTALLREMEKVVQEGSTIAATGRNHDDRVFAMGLANKAFIDRLRPMLITEGLTYDVVQQREAMQRAAPNTTMMAHIVSSFFKERKDEKQAAEIAQRWQQAGIVE